MTKYNNSGLLISALIIACVIAITLIGCSSSNDVAYHENIDSISVSLTDDDHQAIQEMNENIGEIRNNIDNDWVECSVCGAHVHDWWYINNGEEFIEVCQFCYQDMR